MGLEPGLVQELETRIGPGDPESAHRTILRGTNGKRTGILLKFGLIIWLRDGAIGG